MTHPAVARIETHSEAHMPDALSPQPSEARKILWALDRQLWTPQTLVALDAQGNPLGVTLIAGRPLTNYRKIVDVFAANDEVFGALIDAVLADPGASVLGIAPLVVHFEEHIALEPLSASRRALLGERGFVAAPAPVPSVPSTRAGDPNEVAVWSRWNTSRPVRLAPYYGQTTEVTCGAVASLMALEQRGAGAFNTESLAENRATEIATWRRATNLPACEPIGLAVEVANSGTAKGLLPSLPSVFLSATGPVLIEEFSSEESERALRIDLQLESLRQAEALRIPIERRWLEVDEIAALVSGGAELLLLIDLTLLINDPTPHWVLASDFVDGSLIISDPWVQYPNGETWADTFALPIPLESIDRITRWGDPSYRGVIVLPG
ncbi:hypothetical protein G7067_13555 [Leucobacter insecticola]|uniref:Uncharacterized protein n=1 Tax=Leucobacter insecticola TaxID=2714934 RepID=A0A6G8FLG5_9MICO|nr:peptidase C39 family protein [Leucobacter insecticola]QIM17205.1 hypothetical protein G7067_13555 [Leucobacter insecticola]